MSLITRCPACGTMFKVVPDQLRISEGWVRCGHCADVFDASAHLQGDDTGVVVSTPPVSPGDAAPAAADAFPESEAFASSLNTEIDEGLLADVPDTAQLDAEAQALQEDPRDQPFVLRRQDTGRAEQDGEAEPDDEVARPPRAQVAPVPEPEAEPAHQDLSFVRQARRKAFWRRPMVRAALVLALIALGLLLALQVAVHDRDRLAASDPALRPLLASLCEPLDCTVRVPRQIEAIAIDGSSFNKLRGDAFRLNVTLKNQAAMDVAMPALELTLTDGQDQTVVRRVLMPAELGPNPGVIPATSEWSGSVALAVAGNGSRIAGYRLLAFYP